MPTGIGLDRFASALLQMPDADIVEMRDTARGILRRAALREGVLEACLVLARSSVARADCLLRCRISGEQNESFEPSCFASAKRRVTLAVWLSAAATQKAAAARSALALSETVRIRLNSNPSVNPPAVDCGKSYLDQPSRQGSYARANKR